jgi:hypothetical protein
MATAAVTVTVEALSACARVHRADAGALRAGVGAELAEERALAPEVLTVAATAAAITAETVTAETEAVTAETEAVTAEAVTAEAAAAETVTAAVTVEADAAGAGRDALDRGTAPTGVCDQLVEVGAVYAAPVTETAAAVTSRSDPGRTYRQGDGQRESANATGEHTHS